MKKKKIAVFGATGFVGMHLCKSLIKHGYEIVVFVRTNKVFPLSKLDKDKTSIVLCGNLNKIKDLGYDFNKVDCIINCAAKAHIQYEDISNEKKYINELTNIERNIVNNVKDLNLKPGELGLEITETAELADEKRRAFTALASSSVSSLQQKTLNWALLSGEVRNQDVPTIISAVSNSKNGGEVCWNFFKTNFEAINGNFSEGKQMNGVLLLEI